VVLRHQWGKYLQGLKEAERRKQGKAIGFHLLRMVTTIADGMMQTELTP
jgi:hypothetical protein